METLDKASVHFNAFRIGREHATSTRLRAPNRSHPLLPEDIRSWWIVHVRHGQQIPKRASRLKHAGIEQHAPRQKSRREMTPSTVSQDIMAYGRKRKSLFGTWHLVAEAHGTCYGTTYFMPSLFRNTAASERLWYLRCALPPLRCE